MMARTGPPSACLRVRAARAAPAGLRARPRAAPAPVTPLRAAPRPGPSQRVAPRPCSRDRRLQRDGCERRDDLVLDAFGDDAGQLPERTCTLERVPFEEKEVGDVALFDEPD